ncbi:MAG: hypothetical protein IH986_04745 [Planctomycetes bacterium]|nr:hypothetical protein [Planctomycetota bacterium]
MRRYTTMGLVCALTVAAAQAVDVRQAREQFRLELPDVHFFEVGTRITTVYGAAFGAGNSPEEVAEQFLENHAGIFGAEFADLEPYSRLADARHTTGLMYQPLTDDYKLTLVYFSQARSGIPVFGADVRLVVRNDPGFPLVLVRNALHDLGDFQVPKPVPPIRIDLVEEAALEEFPGMINLSNPELVIWAGGEDEDVAARLAVSIVADNAKPATPEYEKFLFVVDIATGQILHTQNQILDIDITGNTSGLASPDFRADACISEVPFGLPYAQVQVVGGNSVFADVHGDFVIPHAGNSPVTVRSHVNGEWFTVRDQAAGNSHLTLDQTVTPPGPVDFLHNQANNELTTAQVNTYLQANIVRDLTLAANPDYPTIGGAFPQRGFRVNVNLSSTCNAFYDGTSINFFRSGGGCNNTGFGDVVHHEYGHHLVRVGNTGAGQGEFGEGMGDVMGVLITERSALGVGFRNCGSGIRNANNNCQYQTSGCSSCGSQIHACGQLISGCVWSTRAELMVTEPLNFRTILRDLAINTMFVHTGSSIRPDITIDWLIFDDDDANIGNGTPHYFEIAAGFGAHNMDAPPLELIEFRFPNGLPTIVDPTGGTTVRVEVLPNVEDPQPGSGRFFYNSGAGFVEGTMNEVTPNVYDAIFPAIACPTAVAYYFSAMTTIGNEMRSPANAPDTSHATVAAVGFEVVFEDDFELNRGWSVTNQNLATGPWQRGVPAGGGGRGDPPSDFDGSGQAWVTGNSRNEDVDGGPTTLISPVLDLSGSGSFRISYARWFTSTNGAPDRMSVEISNGGPWVVVESVPNSNGWIVNSFDVESFVAPTATIQMRFIAIDNPNDSITEAGLDAFRVTRVDCAPAFNKGDMNCDGAINGADIDPFFLALGDPSAYTAQFPNCDILNGDMNGDGRVNGGDIDPFFVCLGGGACP